MRRYIYLLVGLISIVIFVEIGYFVRTGPTAVDSTVAQWFKSHRTPGEIRWAQIFSAITVPLIVFIIMMIILLFRQYWTHSWNLLDFIPLGLLVSCAAVATLAKHLFDRVRPGYGFSTQIELDPSYPSSHVAFIAITGGCLLLLYAGRRALILIFVTMITALMAVDRLLLGVHWFSDVVGSIFMAGGLIFLSKFMEESLKDRERIM